MSCKISAIFPQITYSSHYFFKEPFGHFKETFGQNKAAEGAAGFRFPLHFLSAVDIFLILRALPLECVSCAEQLGLVLPER